MVIYLELEPTDEYNGGMIFDKVLDFANIFWVSISLIGLCLFVYLLNNSVNVSIFHLKKLYSNNFCEYYIQRILFMIKGVFLILISVLLVLIIPNHLYVLFFFCVSFVIFLYYKRNNNSTGDNKSFKTHENEKELILFSDEPTENISEEKSKIADNIIDRINEYNSNDYLSIGLDGSWGSGKTSVIKYIQNKLKDEYVFINLNAWQSANADNLLKLFANKLDKFITSEVLVLSKNYLNYFKSMVTSDSFYTGVLNGLVSVLDYCTREKNITFISEKEKVEELISIALKNSNKKKLIVIIDDLDRVVERDEILNIFKVLRYGTGFKNVITITAMDKGHISDILENNKNSQSPRVDSEFINKIFHVITTIQKVTPQKEINEFIKREVIPRFCKYEILYTHLNDCFNKNKVIEVFYNFREVKQTFNDFIIFINELISKKIDFKKQIKPIPLLMYLQLRRIDPIIFRDFMIRFMFINEKEFNQDSVFNFLIEKKVVNRISENSKPERSEKEYLVIPSKERVANIFAFLGVYKLMPIATKYLNGAGNTFDDKAVNLETIRFISKRYFDPREISHEDINHISKLAQNKKIDMAVDYLKSKNEVIGQYEIDSWYRKFFKKFIEVNIGESAYSDFCIFLTKVYYKLYSDKDKRSSIWGFVCTCLHINYLPDNYKLSLPMLNKILDMIISWINSVKYSQNSELHTFFDYINNYEEKNNNILVSLLTFSPLQEREGLKQASYYQKMKDIIFENFFTNGNKVIKKEYFLFFLYWYDFLKRNKSSKAFGLSEEDSYDEFVNYIEELIDTYIKKRNPFKGNQLKEVNEIVEGNTKYKLYDRIRNWK